MSRPLSVNQKLLRLRMPVEAHAVATPTRHDSIAEPVGFKRVIDA